jgi:hypothetical protein
MRLRAIGVGGLQLQSRAAELLASQGEGLAALPSLAENQLKLAVGPGSDSGHALVFTPGAGESGRVALLHALAESDASGGVPRLADREETPRGSEPLSTPRRYPAGARVLWTFATYVPALGCDMVAGWREVTIP